MSGNTFGDSYVARIAIDKCSHRLSGSHFIRDSSPQDLNRLNLSHIGLLNEMSI